MNELTAPIAEDITPVPAGPYHELSHAFIDDIIHLLTQEETHRVFNVDLNEFIDGEDPDAEAGFERLSSMGLSVKNFVLEMIDPPSAEDPSYTPPMLISFVASEEGFQQGTAVGVSATALAPDENWFIGSMGGDVSFRGEFPLALMQRLRSHIGDARTFTSFELVEDEVTDAVEEGASITD